MKITIPEFCLVVLIGPSGSGKSTFARTHFKPTESISSDFCRGLVSDDENDQTISSDAFDVLYYIAGKRLALGKLTVIDATNVRAEDRKRLFELARTYHALAVGIVFNLPEKLCHERNSQRPDRQFGPHVVHRQLNEMRRSFGSLRREGFHHLYFLDSAEKVASVEIERERVWNNRKDEHGPLDIIGDVHGCFEELQTLLERLGYQVTSEVGEQGKTYHVTHPEGRKVVFLGDLVDRGPATPEVLRLVMDMVEQGSALCVPGNHDAKLWRKLDGRNVQVRHGLAETLEQMEKEAPEFYARVKKFLDSLISHYVLDDGKLVVAHAGLKAEMHGRTSRAVREFALYGETTGETDEFGLPVRYNWAAEYRGQALVVYGHTPVPEAEWLNNTINIDGGCVFGGKLIALRYPERELVEVSALQAYSDPVRPLQVPESKLSAQQQHDDLLDIEDVSGKRYIPTRLKQTVAIREENAVAALEIMSRFAANPKWLLYLPPTMSPAETSREPGFLEHPREAFAYYREEGIERVICEEKHMGSRAVVIICRDEEVARQRFGVIGEGSGICYTRTGRRFFEDASLEAELLQRLRAALERANFWTRFETDWVCLDCELMPWSVKAQSLLLKQYAAVGAASRASLGNAVSSLRQAAEHGFEVEDLLKRYEQREHLARRYVEAYRRYCWPVTSLDDLKLAPFHLLATEGRTYFEREHTWHMQTLAEICAQDEQVLLATAHQVVDLTNEASIQTGIDWWLELTGRGGEGMVVKPINFIAQGKHGLVQPAIKSRGPEYLRIIYGPEYSEPEYLERLRKRGLSAKRSMALREFALGVEALERFVKLQPLRGVHECVFGVLALESEPVDPRL
ncbi:polynucleotide kinase-phosphatase [Ktedonobacter sp. SOSP1-52]|uniref:polynucleotide kinase-phosphatase n=1 Tax=Ktedonobacter sp. SOSP1-52 TaxID=2778366 RepID=UPI00191686E9|nr:polynucleotide kinase-phosphatase [Ktedonobacter sp. SOSP1-52]GHO67535.1 polynucleotide kinase-phosphatase [Ktedonobacter sp. SOSP1-52]